MTELTQYVYAFDKANEPIARAKDGDEFSFRTLDCYSGQVCTEEDIVGESFNFSRTNPATGPLYVEGAMPGDVLVVDVLSVEVADKGAVTTIPNIGPLYDRCVDRTRILPVKDGKTELGGLSIPINPMIGVMGVAPAGEPIACGYAGKHGGNMDSKKLTAGSRVYLPVQVEGALLQMGDIHAVMGDCELCGTGLEIGGVITVRVSVLKGRKLDWPVIETADAWHVVSARKDYTSALIDASAQMQELVCAAYGLDPTDAYLYLSLEGDVCINQGCQPCPVEIVLRISMPKRSDKPLLKEFREESPFVALPPRLLFLLAMKEGKNMSPVFRTGKTGGNERGRLHPRGRAVLYKGSEGRAPAFPEGSPPGERVHGRTFRRVCFVPRTLSQHLWRLQWLKKKGPSNNSGTSRNCTVP